VTVFADELMERFEWLSSWFRRPSYRSGEPTSSMAAPMIRDVEERRAPRGVPAPFLKASAEGEFESAFASLVQCTPVRWSWAATRFYHPQRAARGVGGTPFRSGGSTAA